ncbi:MAG: hypothetical protein WED10_10335, partial [Brumimicrobium sp.]
FFCLLMFSNEVLFSQTVESETYYRAQQDSVFSIIFSQLDLAKKKINDLALEEENMADSTRGLNYSLKGIYNNIVGENNKAIKNFDKAIILLKDNPERKAKVRINLGTTLRNNNDYEASIAVFEKLLKFYKNQGDSIGVAKMKGEIAANYNLTLNSGKAVEYLLEAISILESSKQKTSLDLGILKQRLANTYMKQERFDFANSLYNQSLKAFKKNNSMQNYYLTLVNYAECLNYTKKYDSALLIINQSFEGLESFKNINLLAIAHSVKGSVMYNKGDSNEARKSYQNAFDKALSAESDRLVQIARDYLAILVEHNEFENASLIIDKTLPYLERSNLEYQFSFLFETAKCYAAIGDKNEAYDYAIKAHALKDSVYYKKKQELIEELQTRYLVQEKEKSNSTLKSVILRNEENLSLLTIITFTAILMVVFMLIIWKTRMNYKNKILNLEKRRTSELSKKLNIEKENTELRQKLIDQQRSELLGYSMEISNMNEKIERLIEKIDVESDSSLGPQLKSLITVNKSWNSFIERFKEVDPDFIPKLSKKFPKLTQKDLEFCSLVRINISYKDIANFLQISHESVFKKKYRVLKKMKLDKDVDFQNYIIHF